MSSQNCRLYDENIVRNIMISTGLSIAEYLRKNSRVSVGDVCEYIELNANIIIENTIEDLNRAEENIDGLPQIPDDDTWDPDEDLREK